MLNVLYVEDDGNSRNVVRMVQRMNPGVFEATIFDDSQDFEARLLELHLQPDLILLDIHMKPYTGFEMLEIIRKHRDYNKIPVVALTASVMNEEIQLLQDASFHSVLSKPLNMDEFPTFIERIMAGEHIWHVW
ncbi:MAG: response regulator [Anaerolineaceae bacterium]|nr:response regulator [Anaerolineaceae bacterium]